MIDVGILFGDGAVPPAGVGGWNERLFVRLMVSVVVPGVPEYGTVMTIGDQVDGVPATVDADAGFNAAHATGTVLVDTGVPQK